ncbi:MAG: TIGR02996 domain-containing protein [Planctomycetes bacterium]|nr:TIGR02996 domain-containing protein [Planctomycetota bacterium]
MRTFLSSNAKQFWNIDLQENQLRVTAGKVGSPGRTSTKKQSTPQEARTASHRLIREKLGKGYIETTHGTPTPESKAFERAIAADPNDGTGWRAYADYLVERNDPRGEFMQVQFALEDETLPKAARKKLQTREAALLKEHEREWLGELAPFMLEGDEHGVHKPVWRNGFLAGNGFMLPVAFAQELAIAPAARFLRELRLSSMGNYGDTTPFLATQPPGVPRHASLFELIGSQCLRTVQVFQIGFEEPEEDSWCECYSSAWGLEHVISQMPRIEELHLLCGDYEIGKVFALPNLQHLRVFRAFHLGGRGGGHRYEYPLDVLAKNPAVGNLTHLLFHPHCPEGSNPQTGSESYLPLDQVKALVRSKCLPRLTHLQLRLSDAGDKGTEEIVKSGILKQLKWLDLRHGCITDEGAKVFAACTDSRNLERLDLTRNAVTAKGLKLLRAAGVNAVANNPLTAQAAAQHEYLREGAFE